MATALLMVLSGLSAQVPQDEGVTEASESAVPPGSERPRGSAPTGGNTLIVDDDGQGNYTSIQDAVDNASIGSTIEIWEGVYEETVLINRTMTLEGNGSATTTVDALGGANAIVVSGKYVNITGLTITNGTYGFSGSGVYVNTYGQSLWLDRCVLTGNDFGCYLKYGGKSSITNCTIVNNTQIGAQLESGWNLVDNNTFSDNFNTGLVLVSTSNIISNNTFLNQTLWGDSCGIGAYNTYSHTIQNNTFENCNHGIYLRNANELKILDNHFTDCGSAVSLTQCKDNVMQRNTMDGCGINFRYGSEYQWTSHSIDTSNEVNGKPVRYLSKKVGGSVPSNTGQVILANCSGVKVCGLSINASTTGVTLGLCDNIVVSDSTITNCSVHGVYLRTSTDCVIEENAFSGNNISIDMMFVSDRNIVSNNTLQNGTWGGIMLMQSWDNEIIGNTCNSNGHWGIRLYECDNVLIRSNIVSNHTIGGIYTDMDSSSSTISHNECTGNTEYGIYLGDGTGHAVDSNLCSNNGKGIAFAQATGNIWRNDVVENQLGIHIGGMYKKVRVYHNNIKYNTGQALDDGSNTWCSYNNEGNYWSDYCGADNGADGRTAGDGIGDTNLPHYGLDHYPFISESAWYIPGAPVLRDSVNVYDTGNFSVNWFPGARAISHTLQMSAEMDFSEVINNTNTTEQYVQFTDIEDGSYFFRARGHTDMDKGPWSNILNIIVDLPPATPKNFNVTPFLEGNALIITWTPNTDEVTHYRVVCKYGTVWAELGTIEHPGSHIIHDGIGNGIDYSYYIQAIDARGQYSPQSKVVNRAAADTVAPLPPDGLFVHTINSYTCWLTWDASESSDVEGYNIYRSTEPEPEDWGYPVNGHILMESPSFTDVNLTELTKYYFIVKAVDEVPNESDPTEVVSGTTLRGPHTPGIHEQPEDVYMVEDTTFTLHNCLDLWFYDPNWDPLTYSCPDPGPFSVFIYPDNGTLVLRPDKNWCGQEKLTFTATDGEEKVSDTLWVNVRPVNDPPMIHMYSWGVNGTRTDIHENELLELTVHCSDPDTLYGDSMEVEWISNIYGTLGTTVPVGNSSTMYNVSLCVGTHQLTIKVTDEEGAATMVNFTVTVTETVWGDIDGDGMPNGWERDNNLDPYDPMDAFEDPDNDGYSNLEEYLAGTDPWYDDRPYEPYEPPVKPDPDPQPNYTPYYVLLALAVLIPVIVMLLVAWRRRPRRKVDDGVPMLVPEAFDGGFKKPRHKSPYDKDVKDGEIIDIGGEGAPVGEAPPGGGSGGGFPKEMAVGSGRVEAHNRLLPAVKGEAGSEVKGDSAGKSGPASEDNKS